jgi:hypothetical protein
MKKMYLGGRFPVEMREKVLERANQLGMSINEYLEATLSKAIEDSPEPGEALQYIPSAEIVDTVDLNPDPIEAPDLIAEEPMLEVPWEDETEGPTALPIEAPTTAPQAENLQPIEQIRAALPPLLAGELHAEIVATWNQVKGGIEEPKDKKLAAVFFEQLGENLKDKKEAPRKINRDAAALLGNLPPSYQAEFIPVILEAANELGANPTKDRFFDLLGDLLFDEANRLFVDARAFDLVFERAEYVLIDAMIEKLNQRREKPLADLQAWIFDSLADALADAGDGGMFKPDNQPMLDLANIMKERAENRK